MGGQQEFNNILAPLLHLFAHANYNHALRNRHRTGSFELPAKLNFLTTVFFQHGFPSFTVENRTANIHQAHPAHTHGFHLGVVAENRDIDTNLFGGVYDQGAFGHSDGLTVDGQGNFFRHKCSTKFVFLTVAWAKHTSPLRAVNLIFHH